MLETGWSIANNYAGGASGGPPASVSWYTQEFNDRFGKGAVGSKGTFVLMEGRTLKFRCLVGQTAGQSGMYVSGGGGGGTFVGIGMTGISRFHTPHCCRRWQEERGDSGGAADLTAPTTKTILRKRLAGTIGVDSSTPGGTNGYAERSATMQMRWLGDWRGRLLWRRNGPTLHLEELGQSASVPFRGRWGDIGQETWIKWVRCAIAADLGEEALADGDGWRRWRWLFRRWITKQQFLPAGGGGGGSFNSGIQTR